MTIDERIERLTERHEALAQTVEILTADVRTLTTDVRTLATSVGQLESFGRQTGEALVELMQAVRIHEHVLRDHEGRLQTLEG